MESVAGSPGEGRRVLVIGDSLTRESRQDLIREMRAQGWTPTIRCWGGKRLDWGLAQLKRAKSLGQLPEIVVLGLGTNDMRWIDRSVTKSRLERFVKAVGPQRQLIVVGTYARGADRLSRPKERWFNNLAADLAANRSNVHALDWGSFARANRVKFRDGLHYTRAGEKAYAAFIVDALGSRLN
jgi:lysophospholipase L1-like esterase